MEAYRDPPNVELERPYRRCKYDDITQYITVLLHIYSPFTRYFPIKTTLSSS